MKTTSLFLLLAATVLLSGCLTSPNPFYEQADIIQDDRLVGDYAPADADEGYSIRSDMDHKGRYLVRCYEGKQRNYWIERIGTLFKVGGKTFLDLYPSQDSSFRHIGGTPPGSVHILHSLVFQPLHLVARAEFNELGEVGFSFPRRGQLDALFKRESSMRQFDHRETLLLPMQTPDLRKLLEKHGTSDEVFRKPDKFQKPRSLSDLENEGPLASRIREKRFIRRRISIYRRLRSAKSDRLLEPQSRRACRDEPTSSGA